MNGLAHPHSLNFVNLSNARSHITSFAYCTNQRRKLSIKRGKQAGLINQTNNEWLSFWLVLTFLK